MAVQNSSASKRAATNAPFCLPVTDRSKRPTMPMRKDAVTSKETATSTSGSQVRRALASHRNTSARNTKASVLQGAQQRHEQRQRHPRQQDGEARRAAAGVERARVRRVVEEA